MTSKCNFIITHDKNTAESMILSGFHVVSHVGDMYTFLNQPPKHFNFADIDKGKVVYTNMLNI
jgi:hypothetical protein